MPIGEIKSMLKSFLKFWWMSPEAICEVYEEKKSDKDITATTSLRAYRRFYK